MKQLNITLPSMARGIHLITDKIEQAIGHLDLADNGLLHIFLQHTSAALCLNENADSTVRTDMEAFLDKLVPENLNYFQHTLEGPDDMPAHIKSVLVGNSLTIPLTNRKLALGTWQGIYLLEYRNHGGARKIVLTIQA